MSATDLTFNWIGISDEKDEKENRDTIIALPIHDCIYQDSLALLKANSSRDNVDEAENGFTPLMRAANLGKFDMVKHLCSLGATLEYYDNEGLHAAWWAAVGSRWAIVKYLLRKGTLGINVRPEDGEFEGATILLLAAKDKQWDMVLYILQHYKKIDLNASFMSGNLAGSTALDLAIKENNLAIVMELVKSGAEINPNRPITPLMLAVTSLSMFSYLLDEAGCIVDIPFTNELIKSAEKRENNHLRSVACTLFDCIKINQLEKSSLTVLLNTGANFNQRCQHFYSTPLLYSLKLNHSHTTSVLLWGISSRYNYAQQELLLKSVNSEGCLPLDLSLKQYRSESKKFKEMAKVAEGIIDPCFKDQAIRSIIFGYLKPHKSYIDVLNVIQPIIDHKVFHFKKQLIQLKFADLPKVLTKRIFDFQKSNLFSKTTLGQSLVRKGYLKASQSTEISFALERVRYEMNLKQFSSRSLGNAAMILRRVANKENVPPKQSELNSDKSAVSIKKTVIF